MRPTDRDIRIAAVPIVAAGLAACGVAIFAELLDLGPEASRGTFGWKRIALLSAGGAVLVGGSLLMARPQILPWPDWLPTARDFTRRLSERYLGYLPIALLVLLGIVLVWTRLIHIDHSIWHDEAFTIVTYSGVGPGAILLGESPFAVNNHPAYNLLSWLTVGLLGESEAIYRFWSVWPGIAAIGLGAWWAWRRIGPVVAVAFATIAAAAPLHLEYVPQARGYGLALLAATLMLVAADRLTRAYSGRALLGFVGAGVVGIWTLSIFAIAFVGQGLALLRWRNLRLPAIAAVAAAGALSMLFYAPVLGEMLSREHMEPSGVTIPWTAALLLDRPLEWLVIPTVTMLTGDGAREPIEGSGVAPDAPWATWLDVAVLALLVIGLVALWRRGEGGLVLILLVPPLFFNLAFSLGDLTTVTRHQLFLLPFVLIPVATGISELGRIVARQRFLKPMAVAVGVAVVVTLSGAILEKKQRRDLPRENFQQVANVVDRTEIDDVVTDSRRPHGLRYYLGDRVQELPLEWIEPLLCGARQEIVYIHHRAFSDPYWDPADLDCLASKPVVRVRVPQLARGSAIDVWIIEPRAGREAVEDDLGYALEP